MFACFACRADQVILYKGGCAGIAIIKDSKRLSSHNRTAHFCALDPLTTAPCFKKTWFKSDIPVTAIQTHSKHG
jgi:hypothetical protein